MYVFSVLFTYDGEVRGESLHGDMNEPPETLDNTCSFIPCRFVPTTLKWG